MTKDVRKAKGTWEVRNALAQMRGMEHATRLLLGDLDRELVDRDSYGIANSPKSIGVAVTTTVQCALFCEYAIKTFHASITNGSYFTGHRLAKRSQDKWDGIYDHLERRYIEVVKDATSDDLNNRVISEMRSREARCPDEWVSDIKDVRTTLQIGSANFDDWRYGYAEGRQLFRGIPKALFCIGKGIELLNRRVQQPMNFGNSKR